MTTKRKPLPYAAAYQVDQALMELSDLTRTAMKLVNLEVTTEENKMRLLTKIINHAYQATLNLKEISRQKGEKSNE